MRLQKKGKHILPLRDKVFNGLTIQTTYAIIRHCVCRYCLVIKGEYGAYQDAPCDAVS